MSVEQHKDALRRWVDALRPGNLSTIEQLADEIFTEDCVAHGPTLPDLPPGPAGVKQFIRGAFEGWPDFTATLEDMVAEGDRVAVRMSARGTDATTGKPMTLTALWISRFVDGKIAEEWVVDAVAEGA
jgi:ketosteroid isomerase-like protein